VVYHIKIGVCVAVTHIKCVVVYRKQFWYYQRTETCQSKDV